MPSTSVNTEPASQAPSGDRNRDSLFTSLLGPFASLKLTTALLVAATFMTWVATLQQTRMDIWEVKRQHFGEFTESGFRPHFFVYMPFQHFDPPGWNLSGERRLPGGMWLPSGLLVILMLLANLTAAHLLRFRVTGKGFELLAGILTIVFGAGISIFVIWFNQLPTAIQGQLPPFVGMALWYALKLALAGIAASVGWSAWRLFQREGSTGWIEPVALALLSLSMFGLFGYLLWKGQDAYIGDSGMRILWQLFQGGVAGIVLLIGCGMVFGRRAGIVLLHAGIAMLLLNEIYVSSTNVEQRLSVFEGSSTSHSVDIRATEFAVYEVTDSEFEEGIRIPGRMFERGERIQDDRLPFDVQCIEYMPNVPRFARAPMAPKKATRGMGATTYVPMEAEASTGTASEQVADYPAAYVRIYAKSDSDAQSADIASSGQKDPAADLGTYLVGVWADQNEKYDSIRIGDKTYQFALRFKQIAKPYTVQMLDVTREDYVGTTTPKHYESHFVLQDHQRDVETEQRIWMNNPLRYGGETFYQSGYDVDPVSGREITVIQLVKNEGWMIPYIACMFVVIGMGGQLWIVIRRQAGSRATERSPSGRQPSHPAAVVEAKLVARTNVRLATETNVDGMLRGTAEKSPLWQTILVIAALAVVGLFAAR